MPTGYGSEELAQNLTTMAGYPQAIKSTFGANTYMPQTIDTATQQQGIYYLPGETEEERRKRILGY